MKVPQELENLITTLLNRVRFDPQHNLEFNARQSLYAGFGVYENEEVLRESDGSWRLVLSPASHAIGWLAILTARKVLPVWEQSEVPVDGNIEPYSYDPFEMLQIAEGVLTGTVDADIARGGCVDRFYYGKAGIERLTTLNTYQAMETAYEALKVVTYGIDFLVDHDFADVALLAYSAIDNNAPGVWWDCSVNEGEEGQYFDSEIFQDKTSNEKRWRDVVKNYDPIKFDLPKRLEFWEWWLTEAIPHAWELASRTCNSKY